MTALVWDAASAKEFEYGVDRGVLYLENGSGVPWNGLTAVEERFTASASTPLYFDGNKYNDFLVPNDYTGVMRAYTYPDEFLEYEGTVEAVSGWGFSGQDAKRFGLSWRTKVGNGNEQELGYKLHILQNVIATPSARSFKTMSSASTPVEFEWTISAVPSKIPGFRPACLLIVNSTRVSADILSALEDILYGTVTTDAYLPPFTELMLLILPTP